MISGTNGPREANKIRKLKVLQSEFKLHTLHILLDCCHLSINEQKPCYRRLNYGNLADPDIMFLPTYHKGFVGTSSIAFRQQFVPVTTVAFKTKILPVTDYTKNKINFFLAHGATYVILIE